MSNFDKMYEDLKLMRGAVKALRAKKEPDPAMEAALDRCITLLNEIRLDYEWAETLLEFIEDDIGETEMRAHENAAFRYWSEKMGRERG